MDDLLDEEAFSVPNNNVEIELFSLFSLGMGVCFKNNNPQSPGWDGTGYNITYSAGKLINTH